MFDPPLNQRVAASIRGLYLAAGVLFLVTIAVGFANVFGPAEIDRGQLLAHFHSGSLGWVTLSIVATTLWAFTAGRDPGPGATQAAAIIAWVGAVAVAGYIAAFWLVFSDTAAGWLLPLFGVPSGLVIIAAFAFTVQQRTHIDWAPSHLLLSGALLVASLGATMGILIGLAHAGILDVFPEAADRLGSHAGPMDMYLALAFAAIAERLLGGPARLGRWVQAQAGLGVLSGFLASLALFLGIGPLIPAALLLFVAAFVIYFVRVGHRFFKHGLGDGVRAATFFGALFFPVYIGFFVFLVGKYFSQGLVPPHELLVAFPHITFVGMATNLVLAAHASYSPPGKGMRVAILLLNAGLILFIAGASAAGDRYSAIIMGLGALMAVAIAMKGHWAQRS